VKTNESARACDQHFLIGEIRWCPRLIDQFISILPETIRHPGQILFLFPSKRFTAVVFAPTRQRAEDEDNVERN